MKREGSLQQIDWLQLYTTTQSTENRDREDSLQHIDWLQPFAPSQSTKNRALTTRPSP
jgi:hypothetical protein